MLFGDCKYHYDKMQPIYKGKHIDFGTAYRMAEPNQRKFVRVQLILTKVLINRVLPGRISIVVAQALRDTLYWHQGNRPSESYDTGLPGLRPIW